ncbi:hypothetical protein ABZU75_06870 [Streptosporangium sp. NPDC005286]|uniref:hypothetical protein n=1 Tax=Streptosporangium sp. NPDC005286 TaxID=3154463 RepID=UPI0033AFA59A
MPAVDDQALGGHPPVLAGMSGPGAGGRAECESVRVLIIGVVLFAFYEEISPPYRLHLLGEQMFIVRYLITAVLAASAVALTAPVAYADPEPLPPWSPLSEDYEPSGTLTVRNGDRTETRTWVPGHQSYRSTENSSSSLHR